MIKNKLLSSLTGNNVNNDDNYNNDNNINNNNNNNDNNNNNNKNTEKCDKYIRTSSESCEKQLTQVQESHTFQEGRTFQKLWLLV